MALGWLLIVAPVELASTLAARLSGPMPAIGLAGAALVLLRILTVAAGLMLGRHLAQGDVDVRRLALAWACADLGTLALVLASTRLPSNRPPGDAPFVWGVYALAALVVVLAARRRPEAPPERVSPSP